MEPQQGQENSMVYRFADFTRSEYRKLIDLAKRRYVFRLYDTFQRDENFVIWRHDVDLSLVCALDLARLEAEEGVRATYFLLLRGEGYNLLERSAKAQVKEIVELGHSIGLHFDMAQFPIRDAHTLEERLTIDRGIMEEELGLTIGVFSFHNPDEHTLPFDDWEYGAMINATASYFRHEVGYCSDSNGYWRFGRLYEVLNDGLDVRLQVLTHPVWWPEEVMSPLGRIHAEIDARAQREKLAYAALLQSAGRKLIDWT